LQSFAIVLAENMSYSENEKTALAEVVFPVSKAGHNQNYAF
jgi:hypothetical protein